MIKTKDKQVKMQEP